MAEKVGAKKVSSRDELKYKNIRKVKENGTSSNITKNSINGKNIPKDSLNKPSGRSSQEGTPRSGTPRLSRGNTPKPCTPKPDNPRSEQDIEDTEQTERVETPKPYTPKSAVYQYDKEKLLELRRSPLSLQLPKCLSKYRDVLPDIILDEARRNLDVEVKDPTTGEVTVIRFEDGIDSEGWYKHIHVPRGGVGGDDSRGSSPLTLSALPVRPGPGRGRPAPETDATFRRKEAGSGSVAGKEEDDNGGIVLGPQRKSFDTGCHVSTLTGKLDRSGSGRRIGSGRLALGRHSGDSVEESPTGGSARLGERKELPDLQSLRRQASERGGEGWPSTDRFYRATGDRFRRQNSERDDDRDFGDRRYDDRRRGGGRGYDRMEQEPEWFSAGPTSQQDQIELHGFEGPRRRPAERMHRQPSDEQEEGDEQEVSQAGEKRGRIESVVSVSDRNGSLETNESSSPETSHEERLHAGRAPSPPRATLARASPALRGESPVLHRASPALHNRSAHHNAFDINDMLAMDGIPGFDEYVGEGVTARLGGPAASVGGGMSRFSRFFAHPSAATPHSTSRSGSRRSSINEEFAYLNDLVSGTKSPALASPELDDPLLKRVSPANHRLAPHPVLLSLLQAGQAPANRVLPHGVLNASDVEADLKALLLSRRTPPPSHERPPHTAVLPAGRVLTAAELEASLTGQSTPAPSSQPLQRAPLASHALPATLGGGLPPQPSLLDASGPPLGGPALPVGGSEAGWLSGVDDAVAAGCKVKTVSELEAELRQRRVGGGGGAYSEPRLPTTSSGGGGDMAAFQRLLGLVQQARPHAQMSSRASPTVNLLQMMQGPHHSTPANPPQKQLVSQQLLQLQQQQLLQARLRQAVSAHQPAVINPQQLMTSQAVMTGGQRPLMSLKPPATGTPKAASPMLGHTSPRAPSPIMFGSAPPLHLAAPAPVHASPSAPRLGGPAGPGLGAPPPAQHRVPSPAELHTHAQAILQQALIKRQLEGQKQRFLQKQQQGPSPVPGEAETPRAAGAPAETPASQESGETRRSTPTAGGSRTSTPSLGKGCVDPAFVPTSVIRKLANDKMEEKERRAETPEEQRGVPVRHLAADLEFSASESRVNAAQLRQVGGEAETQGAQPHTPTATAPPQGMPQHTPTAQQYTPAAPHHTPTSFQHSIPPQTPVQQSPHTPGSAHSGHAGFFPTGAAYDTPISLHQGGLSLQAGMHPAISQGGKMPRPLVGQGMMTHQVNGTAPGNHLQQGNQALQSMLGVVSPPGGALGAHSSSPQAALLAALAAQQQQQATSQALRTGAHAGQLGMVTSQAAAHLHYLQQQHAAQQQHGRPIIKAAQPACSSLSPPTQPAQAPSPSAQQPVTSPPQQRPIVGGAGGGVAMEAARLADQARQLQLLQARHYPGAPQLSAQQQQQLALLMGHPGLVPQYPGLQSGQYAALQQQQQQRQLAGRQHSTGPAQYPPMPPSSYAQPIASPGASGHYPGGAPPQPRSLHGVHHSHALQQPQGYGRSSPPQQGGEGLARFFGKEVLKQPLGPPLPAAAHSIVTVQDLERR